ncbi:single-stranded DNA-binding protein [Bifidobacterium sp. UTBIF-78]|uniref:single-stranded DNA-binding protein n=1 Tax=Bifidobacterium sp. UTBIF-78 TaxID=1465263 RepID=UPI001128FD92|nr:single-stranded DNA-binding protein [Bifidobacterium sp. UTBIF-78]TPF95051.1 hypothetical protein BG22_03980 [Bifidobacterium sp. UTBIF-78]
MAHQQAAVTVTGFVAGELVKAGTDAFPVLTFRMGSTRSRFNQNTRQWEDYATAWLTVKAFRAMALNAKQSLRRGDRIIVVGVLNTEQWTTSAGESRSRTVIEATNIGHDLTFGTTSLDKLSRNIGGANGQANADDAGESRGITNTGSAGDLGNGGSSGSGGVQPVTLGVDEQRESQYTAPAPTAQNGVAPNGFAPGADSAEAYGDVGEPGADSADSSEPYTDGFADAPDEGEGAF